MWQHLLADFTADRDRLVLWLPVCLGAGIAVYFSLSTEPGLAVGLALTVASAVMFAAARRTMPLRAVTAALLLASLGFLVSQLETRHLPPMPELPRKAVLATGRVAAIDIMSDGRRRITLAATTLAPAPPVKGRGKAATLPIDQAPVAETQTTRRLRIRLREDDPVVLATGDLVRIRALLHPPSPPDYPGGRDPQRDAFFAGTAGAGTALSPVVVLPRVDTPGWLSLWGFSLRGLREAIALRIVAVLPGPRGAVATTLLTGLTSAIPQSDRDAFAASGLAHLLAVAGLHLGIVMGLTLVILRVLLATWEWGSLRLPMRQIAALGALLAGAAYMALTGLHLPGMRSLAMASIGLLGLLAGRRAMTMRTLAAAALLLLLIDPATLLEVGYQMSFAAVMALIAGYEALQPLMRRMLGSGGGRWRRKLAVHGVQLFFTSLIAGSASLPYAAYHFGRVQFYFVLANLVAVPLTALWVMPQGVLSLLLMPFGLEWVTLRQMGAGIDLILWLARTVAAFPAASLAVPAAPMWGLLMASFGLLWLCLWRRRWRLLAVVPLTVGLASPWLIRAPDLLMSGDGRLIALQDGGAMLVRQAAWADPVTMGDWRRAWAVTTPAVPLGDTTTPAGERKFDPDAAMEVEPAPVPHATVPHATGAIACDAVSCLVTLHGRGVRVLLRELTAPSETPPTWQVAAVAFPATRCAGLALLVSASPLHGACHGVPQIDRFSVWRDGPAAAWIGPAGVRIETARSLRGQRPWVPPPPVAGGRRPTLPMALAE
ncbi:ComEC/Rec2 family competence protein [Lichenicola sp.]|uniref:ComEC/Rec2 family competence protein n=1 Tax=Lichenicola sp. TaxID=2804529 RepID=UPI003B00754E